MSENFASSGDNIVFESEVDNDGDLLVTIRSSFRNDEKYGWINANKAKALTAYLATVFNFPHLYVWYGRMPESNGKSNWTVILHNGDVMEGFTIHRSEYPDRARYDYDVLRHMLGELSEKPDLMKYDGEMISPLFDWK